MCAQKIFFAYTPEPPRRRFLPGAARRKKEPEPPKWGSSATLAEPPDFGGSGSRGGSDLKKGVYEKNV